MPNLHKPLAAALLVLLAAACAAPGDQGASPSAPPTMEPTPEPAAAPMAAAAALAAPANRDLGTGALAPPPEGVAPDARGFDFWLGEWECYTPAGQLAGTNTVTVDWGGRVLQEHWRGAGGGSGTSLNTFDATRGVWHQTWMGAGGSILYLDGGLDAEGRMVLEGTRPPLTGNGDILHRIVWTPDGADVLQKWTYSSDGGMTWGVAADLVYKRKGRDG